MKLYLIRPCDITLLSLIEMKLSKCNFIRTLEKVYDLYKIDNFIEESNTWQDYWHITKNDTKINEYNISYYLKDCLLFPSIKKCIIFVVIICSIERSYSTLHHVKTWLNSTMTEQILSGLCMLSINKQVI